jgi:hypothetical protein
LVRHAGVRERRCCLQFRVLLGAAVAPLGKECVQSCCVQRAVRLAVRQ